MAFAKHEILELLEITTFRTTALTKTKTMHALASDSELKQLMVADAEMSSKHLEELCGLLEQDAHEELTT
ncbi:hypothetical protein [Paenibacillus daejeonensis]|uniref:hypothetical protein n=1 Tax=Paenibacillus daejeonensis TaxID=135193 RepID=UPI00036C8C84|nr:hypothetical protein [Paenibacillus daejeonensis]